MASAFTLLERGGGGRGQGAYFPGNVALTTCTMCTYLKTAPGRSTPQRRCSVSASGAPTSTLQDDRRSATPWHEDRQYDASRSTGAVCNMLARMWSKFYQFFVEENEIVLISNAPLPLSYPSPS
jgi:hypothetical protein